MITLLIWTDGSCLRNPGGPGGWACLLKHHDGRDVVMSGHEPSTTNNRMELMAAIKALETVQEQGPYQIALYSDSQYLVETMRRGWKRKVNLDLWGLLDHLQRRHRIEWRWVKAHNGDPNNERVDRLAYRAAQGHVQGAHSTGGTYVP